MKTHPKSAQSNPAQSRSANHLGKAQQGRGTDSRVAYAQRLSNQLMSTEELLAVLKRETPRFFELCSVVGEWVWIQFPAPQPKRVTELLSRLGFHWSRRRAARQHPCGKFSDAISNVDPRHTYGCYAPVAKS